jgi:SAM-dependent methyltransferase
MLCQWAKEYGIRGTGVDISSVFLQAAEERALELGVVDHLSFVHGDAGRYSDGKLYDRVSCIGATWIGGGLAGTLTLMKRALRPDGMLLVGEPYWNEPPPDAAIAALGVREDDFVSLVGTLDRFEDASLDLVEMVLADGDSWDRYMASQWMAVGDYLAAHPGDPEAEELRAWLRKSRRAFLEFERRYLGWGVFVLRPV